MPRSMCWSRRRGEPPYKQSRRLPPVSAYSTVPGVAQLKLPFFCTLIAGTIVCACKSAEVSSPVSTRINRQPIQVIHYGDDGALAQIEGKAGLYAVIFDPDCQGCQLAERAIEPTAYETNLCEFRMIASGEILKPTSQLSGTLKINRVDGQPNVATGHREGHLEQPCHQSIKDKS